MTAATQSAVPTGNNYLLLDHQPGERNLATAQVLHWALSVYGLAHSTVLAIWCEFAADTASALARAVAAAAAGGAGHTIIKTKFEGNSACSADAEKVPPNTSFPDRAAPECACRKDIHALVLAVLTAKLRRDDAFCLSATCYDGGVSAIYLCGPVE